MIGPTEAESLAASLIPEGDTPGAACFDWLSRAA
jgi:hypothetical protein